MRSRYSGPITNLFSVGNFVLMAVCALAVGMLAPFLEKRGYPSWALVIRFVGIAAVIICWIVAFVQR